MSWDIKCQDNWEVMFLRQSFMRTQDAKCYYGCKLYLRRGDPSSRMEDLARLRDISPNLTECWALVDKEHWGVDLKIKTRIQSMGYEVFSLSVRIPQSRSSRRR